MRLTHKSKAVLEFLLICGEELLDALPYLHGGLYRYGGWTDERMFERQLQTLETKGWIRMSEARSETGWIAEITQVGDKILNDDIDPEAAWRESWSGAWSLIAFDMPASLRDQRRQLDVWLRKRRFGHLQGSLWITHRYHLAFNEELAARKIDPNAVLLFSGACLSGLSDAEIVRKAWNFDRINRCYQKYLDFLSTSSTPATLQTFDAESFAKWFGKETELWRNAFKLDPFLPKDLLPSGYLGPLALEKRKATYRDLVSQSS